MTHQPFDRLRSSEWISALRERVSRYELTILVAIAVVAGGAWLFTALAGEVMEGDTHALDQRLLLALRNNPADLSDPIGPPWFEEVMRDFTALGGFAVLTIIVLSVIGYLLLQHKPNGALLVGATVVSGVLLSMLLKQGFNRPRPDLVPHGSFVNDASFPSGHSMLSAVTYLTLGALLARLQPNPRLKIYILALATLLTVLVGVSRVYLGVHWPTDVLAGWTAGAVWASVCWLAARWLQRRGQVESSSEDAAEPTASNS
ncbi:MAG: phosphatase PAP2 family protein [Caldilineaceae bacterium]